MQECLVLTGKGVPWDVVMDMDAAERRGFCIASGIVDGGVFNWNSREWKKPNA